MKIDYLTLFPEMFEGVLNHSILKRAQDKGIINVNTINFRDYSINKHNQVDDYPFGGGQGMVLKPEPVFNAMEDINHNEHTRVILMCPQGRPFTGGELPAMTMTDAIVRLIPGVLGNQASHQDDSFSDGLLEFPQYTRPREYKNMSVPEVLLSGNHAHIDQWRHEQKLIRTYEKRPDLLEQYPLTEKDREILETYKKKLKND